LDVITKQSYGAAIRVKPKARLCEPWVTQRKLIEPRGGDRDPSPEIFLVELYSVALE
jgi:hypothetical protein